MSKEQVLIELSNKIDSLQEVKTLLTEQCKDADELEKQLKESDEKIKQLEFQIGGYVNIIEDLRSQIAGNYLIDKGEQKNKYDEAVYYFEKSTREWIACKNANPNDLAACHEKHKWVYLWKSRMDLLLDLEDNKLRHPTKL